MAERHLRRLTRYERRRQPNRPTAQIEHTLMLKWVAGAAVGLVAFQILPVWPLVKLAAGVAVAVAGAVYLPPALDAWRASRAGAGAEGGGASDWWDAYRSALATHKQVTLPHLKALAAKGSALASGGLKSLAATLTQPSPRASAPSSTGPPPAGPAPTAATASGSSS
ncbi:MAG: hypothetical protein IPL40_09025 [Proteobacteria bacterium]|nr:hypothetical protein [Pseudomonadota bacterium]